MKYRYKESNRFYKGCYILLGPVIRLFRPFKATGLDNGTDNALKNGAALICANHSAMIDPILIALSLGRNTHIHVFAKAELYKVPVVSFLIQKLGMICVDRSTLDVASIKTSLNYLKKGEPVVIFPEGTRLSEHDSHAAKSGAVKLAQRAGVPIIPVYIPRKKPFFKRSTIVFGKPYYIEKKKEKNTPEEYAAFSVELMNKIQALEPEM